MSKINGVNCIVDTNYILYKNVYALAKNKTLYGDLERSLEFSFEILLKTYPFRKVYMICDSKDSWRKRIYENYKSKRKELREKQEIDWDFVYNTFEQFKENTDNKRIKYLEGEGLEGDDIICRIVRKTNRLGLSNIIVASDIDINQMLEYSLKEDLSYINIQWKENYINGKLYMPKGYQLFLDEVKNDKGDIFNLNENSDFLSLYTELSEREIVDEIDKEEILFRKIIEGDKSDTIDSVLQIPMKTNKDKLRGIGKEGAKKIWEEYKSEYPNEINFLNDDWIENVVEFVAKNKKVDEDDYRDEIIKNIKMNRRLIHLHEKHLPLKEKEKIKLI